MSLPKHDPGLAAFLKNLDPSLYTISGGESPSAPVAKEVEGLRNDIESRYRETQIREEAEQTVIREEVQIRNVLHPVAVSIYEEAGKKQLEYEAKIEEKRKMNQKKGMRTGIFLF